MLGREPHRIQFETRFTDRLSDVSQALLDVQPQVVHLVGFWDETGKPTVPIAGLEELFAAVGEDVRCVFVQAPGSEQFARGLSSALPRASVIAMLQPAGDRSAAAFSAGFYQALANGGPLQQAILRGRGDMAVHRDSGERLLLLSSGDDATGVNW